MIEEKLAKIREIWERSKNDDTRSEQDALDEIWNLVMED